MYSAGASISRLITAVNKPMLAKPARQALSACNTSFAGRERVAFMKDLNRASPRAIDLAGAGSQNSHHRSLGPAKTQTAG
ncbi:hypothetical protein D3C78_426570 [compost metagenome]